MTPSKPAPAPHPIFVLGCARSGTTLVYSILLASGEFPVYEAETLLLEVGPRRFGDFRRRAARESFLREWLRSKQFLRSGLDPDHFAEEVRKLEGDWVDCMTRFMDRIAERQGKRRWVEKTPTNVYRAFQLARRFPRARFIHVVRDGRDVAASLARLGWSGGRAGTAYPLLRGGLLWEDSLRTAARAAVRLPGRWLDVRYESLIRNPEVTLRTLAGFVGAPLPLERVRRARVGSLGRVNSAFGPSTAALSHEPVERWRRTWPRDLLLRFDCLFGATLRAWGYPIAGHHESLSLASRARWKSWLEAQRASLRVRRWLANRTPAGRLRPPAFEPPLLGAGRSGSA